MNLTFIKTDVQQRLISCHVAELHVHPQYSTHIHLFGAIAQISGSPSGQDLQAIGIKKRGFILRLAKAIKKQVPPLFQSRLPVSTASVGYHLRTYTLIHTHKCTHPHNNLIVRNLCLTDILYMSK